MSDLLPRGIRNNNPFNLRKSKDKWQGTNCEQVDDEFVTFESPVMGCRAAMKILSSYYNKHNLHTIQDIINRFAPPNENDTKQYAKIVADHANLGVNEPFQFTKENVLRILEGMVLVENGSPSKYPSYIHRNEPFWYNRTVYEAAWDAA